MVEDVCLFLSGVFVWSFLEYLIHGWLSHTFETFASRFHAVHHRNPSAVFAIRGWIPLALIWAAATLLFPRTSWIIMLTGMLAGFIAYEAVHYRLHFCQPRFAVEDYLHVRHLLHHQHYPNKCFGVTSALWDLAFGTEPMGSATAPIGDAMRRQLPLTGRTNFYQLRHSIVPVRLVSHLARHLRRL